MANDSTSTAEQNVHHNFEGDARILNATSEPRMEVRKALKALAQELQKTEGCPVAIKAEIKLQVDGPPSASHIYKVLVRDDGSHASEPARTPQSTERQASGPSAIGGVSSPQAANRLNGQQGTPTLSTPGPDFHRLDADDDVVEIRPFKRQKTSSGNFATEGPQQVTNQPAQYPAATPSDTADTLNYLKTWHEEWTRQGGFLYDTLTRTSTNTQGVRGAIEKRMEAVQDVLGQSINASSASAMSELSSITKLIHWLEHCRKTAADKVQAREEKWRSSSATFHDSARREREAAEKRIERKLDEQNELLRKLARAGNVGDGGLGQKSGGSDERSREASLGAQLRDELNMEAGRAQDEPFSIDD